MEQYLHWSLFKDDVPCKHRGIQSITYCVSEPPQGDEGGFVLSEPLIRNLRRIWVKPHLLSGNQKLHRMLFERLFPDQSTRMEINVTLLTVDLFHEICSGVGSATELSVALNPFGEGGLFLSWKPGVGIMCITEESLYTCLFHSISSFVSFTRSYGKVKSFTKTFLNVYDIECAILYSNKSSLYEEMRSMILLDQISNTISPTRIQTPHSRGTYPDTSFHTGFSLPAWQHQPRQILSGSQRNTSNPNNPFCPRPEPSGHNPSDSLYDQSSPVYNPSDSLYDPSSPVYNPSSPVYNPSSPVSPVYNPSDSLYDPSSPAYNPSDSLYDPSSPAYNPSDSLYDPSSPAYNPSDSLYDPSSPAYHPAEIPVYDPSSPVYDPSSPVYNP
jgi:hypothetical protein